MNYSVILFYKYIRLPDPEGELKFQRSLCTRLGLKGRILLAKEGINATVAGTTKAIDSYIDSMNQHSPFSDIAYKRDACDYLPFPKLRIRVRPEIVTLGVDVDPAGAAPKLTPSQFHELIQDPNVVIFDARNKYESAIGRFKGAITPDINLFKELPSVIDSYSGLKDKTVLTYCTGGIRCEKASALLKERGFSNVYALEGGIIEYAKAYPDGDFEGECFVFDDRMSVAFKEDTKLMGACRVCDMPTNTYNNCAVAACNDLFLMCDNCRSTGRTLCINCLEAPNITNKVEA